MVFVLPAAAADAGEWRSKLTSALDGIEEQVIAWRRDIHANPELGNREFRTSALVAEHLRALGLDEVHTGVAHTGVVGILRGGKPGPVIAFRADMDALPLTEDTGLPFASTARTTYNGEEVGVMHACGHDGHTAIQMGTAAVLAGLRDELRGTVVFVFQPAEEGPPAGEEGGAPLMIEEGLLAGADAPEAMFALHVEAYFRAGTIYYRPGGINASSDSMRIVVRGQGAHGAAPWQGRDPVTAAAQIVSALQTIASRPLNLTRAPAVVSIGSIHGGNRGNVIPEQVEMVGTVRALDTAMREDFLERIRRTAEHVAKASGVEATVEFSDYNPVNENDPDLTMRMLPALHWAAGEDNVFLQNPLMFAEDFSHFAQRIPTFYFALGVARDGAPPEESAPTHSAQFNLNERSLILGVRAMTAIAFLYSE